MKVSLNWLRELVATDLDDDALANTLTMLGLEVEETTPVAPPFTGVVVGHIIDVQPHPNADKLRVTKVDIGAAEPLSIVCGAPNAAVGLRVPCATVGAQLPGLEIRAAKLRGVDSFGMLCSARELGLSEEHAGLMALAETATPGQNVRQLLDLDDVVLTLKMTPNRGDCLSMVGIARDLAANLDLPLNLPTIAPVTATSAAQLPVEITAPSACGQYVGRVIRNINARASTPEWMVRRLQRAGMRPISPLVDITNYLTLTWGRPMHAFDFDKLEGGIRVRYPQQGETLELLNDQTVELAPDMLLIADHTRALALGGVMGGKGSMVTDATQHVFLESAWFNPTVIQGKTRTLNLNSDAAFRFERGVDPGFTASGMEIATALVLEICGSDATEVGPLSQAHADLPQRAAVKVRPAQVNRLLGIEVTAVEMCQIWQRLGCSVAGTEASYLVTPPTWRFDLVIEADFAEEVARLYGYNRVPAVPPHSTVPVLRVAENAFQPGPLRHALATAGYQEVINYSFVPEAWEAQYAGNLTPVRLANPIASQMSVMRTSLFGGLLDVLGHNLNHGETRVKLFEIGRCFLSAEANLAAQPRRLAGLAWGPRAPEQWAESKSERVDFFSVKGELEALLAGLAPRFERAEHPALHPGRTAAILVAGQRVGVVGELHPKWQQTAQLTHPAVLFEIDLDALPAQQVPLYAAISRQPAVRRDLALVVAETVPVQGMIDRVNALKLPQMLEFSLFDQYRGQSLPAGQKSVAFRVVMQDTVRSLTDAECDQVIAAIVEVLSKEHGATLRK